MASGVLRQDRVGGWARQRLLGPGFPERSGVSPCRQRVCPPCLPLGPLQVCRALLNLWSCLWQTGVWADGGQTDVRMFLGPGCAQGPVQGGRGSPPPPGAPQRQDWAAWQVSAASGHTSSWGVPALPALTGWVTLLSALAACLPCPVAQGQPGEGTGRPSGRRPRHRGCREAGAGLAPGGPGPPCLELS